jgi:hypothetical protein
MLANLNTVQFKTAEGWNPFTALGNTVAGAAGGIAGAADRKANKEREQESEHEPEGHTEEARTTPTPANTGAPIPGYRKRGSNITPQSTGAPVPGTLKNNTATHPITGAKVPRVPTKSKGKKPTAPGTRPKKK